MCLHVSIMQKVVQLIGRRMCEISTHIQNDEGDSISAGWPNSVEHIAKNLYPFLGPVTYASEFMTAVCELCLQNDRVVV